MLSRLERGGRDPQPDPVSRPQMGLFTQPEPDPLRDRLLAVDPDAISPREAHELLYVLRQLARE